MRFDALTGVFNKRQFTEELKTVSHGLRTSSQSLALMVLDIDHFKRINDTYGHVVGDGVLMELCSVARELMTPEVVFGRVGGEEFAVLWDGGTQSGMLELAERVRKATEQHLFSFEGKRLAVTVSIGVAERTGDRDEPHEAIYERADAKLYEAKNAGRNCVK
jgi:diguanylate cyclase